MEKVNFFFENLSLVPETTRQVMEHFKLVFGSGTSDLAKIRPLKNWHSPDFLSGFALWNFASRTPEEHQENTSEEHQKERQKNPEEPRRRRTPAPPTRAGSNYLLLGSGDVRDVVF